MGWKRVPRPDHWKCDAIFGLQNDRGEFLCPSCQGIPDFSANIKDAWEVVEKMAKDYWFEIHSTIDGNFDVIVTARKWTKEGRCFHNPISLSICRAALLVTLEGDDHRESNP